LQHEHLLEGSNPSAAACSNRIEHAWGAPAGFLLALITERCFFIDFPLYHKLFAPDLDFSWERHAARLRGSFGHDANATQPRELKFWKGEDVSAWLMQVLQIYKMITLRFYYRDNLNNME
jgi:hypothetical protein